MDEDEPALADDALHADDLLGPDRTGCRRTAIALRDREGPEAADHDRDRDDQRDGGRGTAPSASWKSVANPKPIATRPDERQRAV